MKLNFDCCKICDSGDIRFFNFHQNLYFACDKCGCFLLGDKKYKNKKFVIFKSIYFNNITEKEWEDIKQMNIIIQDLSWLIEKCPYYLEHLVEE